jgi:hypothetical protein
VRVGLAYWHVGQIGKSLVQDLRVQRSAIC